MSMSVNVNLPSASANLSKSFLSPQDRTRAKAGTMAVLLSVALGLVLFAVAIIYFDCPVGPTDLLLGQYAGL